MRSSPRTVHVGVLVFPGCVRSGAVVPHDVLGLANQLMRSRPAAQRVDFKAHWVAARKRDRVEAGGLVFATTPPDAASLDALIVPGVDHANADDLGAQIDALVPEQDLLRELAGRGVPLLFGCSATCLVARTGLLDGRSATTSWWLGSYCRAHFPAVNLQAQDILVEDGALVSSAGVTSYFDLALWLVGKHAGDDLRQSAARMLLHDSRRESQAPYVAAALADGEGPVVIERARKWLGRRLDQPWTVQALARHCRTSERTLLRRFKEVAGVGPVQYLQQMRVERAKALLESTLLSLESIAVRCGYQDVSTLHKVFKQWARLTPNEYRSRFGFRA
ncbi:MAG: helix-turn-helix domain-containing protein [Proteobacteria bacterium]|nr:helix-turn-helix domain-containing protein [Pseudomonadota bacterium]